MARTKQCARMRRALGNAPNGEVVANPDLTPEELGKLKELEEGSMRAEMKFIDKRWTEQGQTYFAETKEDDIPEQINWWSQFALCVVRHMGDQSNKWVARTCLQVNSEHLKDILRDTIVNFPGTSFGAKEVSIEKPYHCLFYHRHELQDACDDLDEDCEEVQHHRLLMDFINEEFKEAIATSENLTEQGMINYDTLWTIFKPGNTIYSRSFGHQRAYTLQGSAYSFDPPGLSINVEWVDFDGESMGTRNGTRLIPSFKDDVKIDTLSSFPLEWHPTREAMRQQLVKRGRTWEALAGTHFREYKGITLETKECVITRYHINGKVVVDAKTFHQMNADESWAVNALPGHGTNKTSAQIDDENQVDELDLIPEHSVKRPPLTDNQCMLASSMVRGFSFNERRWLDMFVDQMSEVEWNGECFDQLVLPSAQKDLVKALVSTHVEQRVSLEDLVKGKGKGLIFVLHGPPGVGKTLTAETVAEYAQRPLYAVSSGDLGTSSEGLDQKLGRILHMASTWKAVLLIDEADIFLEQRSLHDLERNALVSIFLRVLEYYEGILFLTSNRVATFDEAFKSRIHVPLKYNDLTHDSRKLIWRNFLAKTDAAGTISDKDYTLLANAEINGRQIKNAIRTAESLAHFHGQKLDRAKLQQVIGIQEEFAHELDLTNVVHVVNGPGKH